MATVNLNSSMREADSSKQKGANASCSKLSVGYSIVIPTLNEERYLPHLLESISKQIIRPQKIIVADAGSRDGTVVIAKRFGAQVVRGGIPAKGRNEGAKAVDSEYIVFLDADAVLNDSRLLCNFFKQMLNNKVDLMPLVVKMQVFPWDPQGGVREIPRRVSIKAINTLLRLEARLGIGHITTGNMIVKRALFEKLGGFDEELEISEDWDLVKRAKQVGARVEFSQFVLPVSARRYYNLKLVFTGGGILLGYFIIRLLSRKKNLEKNYFNKFVKRFYGQLGGDIAVLVKKKK